MARQNWTAWLLASAFSTAVGCGASATNADAVGGSDAGTGENDAADGQDGGDGADGTLPASKVTNTTVSGLVKDGASGKPLYNVTIATDPATATIGTSQQGQYVINVGRAFGLLTVRGTLTGHTQAFPTCVNLRPGVNNLGDVAMARNQGPSSSAECFPPCTGATTCLAGTCVSKCNPLCSCSELCTEEGTCKPNPDAPPSGICGLNSHTLGGGVCECNEGFVPSGDGETCSIPAALTECPEGAERNPVGDCVCKKDPLDPEGKKFLVPSVTGDRCLPADEALTVTAVSDGKLRAEWPAPGPAPRGLAFDGTGLWVGDIGTRKLYQTSIADGHVAKEIALGEDGGYLVDMAHAEQKLYLVLSGTATQPATPTMQRVDLATDQITILAPSGYVSPFGLTFDGFNLVSLEGLKVRRRELSNQIVVNVTDVLFDPNFATSVYTVTPPSTLRFLKYTTGQYLSWAGTHYDGVGLRTELVALNAVTQAQTPEIGRLSLYIGAAQIVGLEATGTTLWLAGAGQGNPVLEDGQNPPKIVEVTLE